MKLFDFPFPNLRGYVLRPGSGPQICLRKIKKIEILLGESDVVVEEDATYTFLGNLYGSDQLISFRLPPSICELSLTYRRLDHCGRFYIEEVNEEIRPKHCIFQSFKYMKVGGRYALRDSEDDKV